MSWTNRGTGSCPNCAHQFSTRWKPVSCAKCGFHLGGTREESAKKQRLNCPDAVLFGETANKKLFSVKTSTRDDRCFVEQEGTKFFCSHQQCKTSRATFVSSDLTDNFSCSHTDKCKSAVAAERIYGLTPETIQQYQGDSSAKDMLLTMLSNSGNQSRFPDCPVVCKVSEISYVVLGLPSTNNTLGYAHVKNNKGVLNCCSKDSACTGFVAKGKYERAKRFCTHLHALFCVGVSTFPSSSQLECSSENVPCSSSTLEPSTSSSTVNISLQRSNTVKLHSESRSIPYEIQPELLRQIDARNKGVELQWPSYFAPQQNNCGLCGSLLGEPVKHSGSDGKAFLITSSVSYKKVEIRVKVCSSTACKAMHQEFPVEIGLFNIADSVLVSLDFLLEWREHFKLGHPISNVITAKLEFLNKKLDCASRLTDAELNYLQLLLYNGYYCFEAITDRDLDEVICGVCGNIGEVYLGDGNEKNCCSNKNIVFPEHNEPTCSTSEQRAMVDLETFLSRIRSHMVEKCVYSRAIESPKIYMQEIPPIIPPALRGPVVLNTEDEKHSSFLKTNEIPEGDAYVLAELISSKQFDTNNLPTLTMPELKEICKKCGIKLSNKSAEKLRCDIHALYATLLVGLCPCHGYNRAPGKTGGFYHIVCRHGTTVASKFLTLCESVRDPADLYLSLRFAPPVFISDSSCGFARHMECRAPDVTNVLWGRNSGCFEKPELGKCPNNDVDVPELVPVEYRAHGLQLPNPEDLEIFQHPITMTTRRYILGDRFHNKSNPHKSPLCVYHDIDKCKQSLTIKTSYQEMENGRKNRRRLRSSCAQSFHVHFLFNYLMDFYQNEAIVKKQQSKLQGMLKEGQIIDRDMYKRFIIRSGE